MVLSNLEVCLRTPALPLAGQGERLCGYFKPQGSYPVNKQTSQQASRAILAIHGCRAGVKKGGVPATHRTEPGSEHGLCNKCPQARCVHHQPGCRWHLGATLASQWRREQGIMGFRRQRKILQECGHHLGVTRITGRSWDVEGTGGCVHQLSCITAKFPPLWRLEFHAQGVVKLGVFLRPLLGFADGHLLWNP